MIASESSEGRYRRSRDSTAIRVAVLGAGTMGRGIVNLLLGAGTFVKIYEPSTESVTRTLDYLSAEFVRVIGVGEWTQADADAALERVSFHEGIARAVEGAEIVLESVPEDPTVKAEVIGEASRSTLPDTPIASNTSALDINVLAEQSTNPSRVLGCHWFNPPEIIPGVEVVAGDRTSATAVERVVDFLRKLGKEPTIVGNSPGFVANRIQEAMMAEAFRCLEEKVATASQIDAIVRNTFGPRLAISGPFELVDQIGLEVQRTVLEHLHKELGSDVYKVPRILNDLIADGRTGIAAGRGVHRYPESPYIELARRSSQLRAVFAAARRGEAGGPTGED